MHKKSIIFNIVTYVLISLIALACIIPMLLVMMVSISSEESIIVNGYQFLPSDFSFEAYRTMLKHGDALLKSYGVSISITILGVIGSIIITACAAYALANKRVKIRNQLSIFFFFTTLFNGGMVPWYIICNKLGLRDNIWALLIPNLLFNCFNMFLIRNFKIGRASCRERV